MRLGSFGTAKLPKGAVSSRHILPATSARIRTITHARKAAVSDVQNEEKDKRRKALEAVLDEINSQYGKGTVMRMTDSAVESIETVPSGSLTLDLALGGGLPVGRIIEIYGPEGSGKTTLALHAMAEVLKHKEGQAAFIDAEHALDPAYAQRLGLNLSEVVITQPESGEQALEIADKLIRSGAFSVICIDSVSALVPKSELEGEVGMTQIGAQARLMSQALRKISGNASKSRTMVIFINQLRNKIGVIYGSPEVTSGGNALKYYASVRIDIRRTETLKGKLGADDAVGIKVKAKVVKNKVSPPYKQAIFDIMFGTGINKIGCLLDVAEKAGVVTRKGTYYYLDSEPLGQGREKAITKLTENPELAGTIEARVRDLSKNKGLLDRMVEAGEEEPGESGDDFVEEL